MKSTPGRISATDTSPSADEQLSQLIDDFFGLAVYWHTWRLMLLPDYKYRPRLESVAGDLLRIVTNSLFESVVVGLARLTDKESTCGRPNLTVKRVLREHRIGSSDVHAQKAMAAADQLHALGDHLASTHRHPYIAHNDLRTAEGRFRKQSRLSIPLGTIDAAFQQFIVVLTELERLRLPARRTFYAAAEGLARASLDAMLAGMK